jgi:proline iminopeptidase
MVRASAWRRRSMVNLALTSLCLILAFSLRGASEGQTLPLTVPPYGNLPVREGHFAGADDVRLFYRIAGDAPDVVVFLHGGPGLGIDDGGYDLEPLAAKGHTLLFLNERGAGRSEVIVDKAKLGIDSYVRDLEVLRQHFDLPRMALIGLSWGSAVVAKYSAAHPDRVTRIVFLSPMSPTLDMGKQRTARLMSMLDQREIARLKEVDGPWDATPDEGLPDLCRESLYPVLKLYVKSPEHLSRTRGDVCGYSPAALRNMNNAGAAGGASLGSWDFRPTLRTINVPSLVVEGEDSNAPLDDAREWAGALPDGRLLLIPEAGHMNWLDQPDAVLSALDVFFRGQWPQLAKR